MPALLDLLLWLGPRMSVAPLLQRLSTLFEAQASANPELASQVNQVTQALEQFGAQFNLLSLLSGLPLLHVPSLLSQHDVGAASPLGEPRVFSITSVLTLIPWWLGLIMAGLVVGAFYLNELASRMSVSVLSLRHEDEERPPALPGGPWKILRILLFEVTLLTSWAVLAAFWLLLVGIAALIAQPLGVLVWVAGVALTIYAALHLIFVIPGILIGERGLPQAVMESVLLSHNQLPSVMGLVVLAVVIYEGLGYAWALPASDSWLLLVGILGNGAIAAGLLAAIFVFYRDRLIAAVERTPAAHSET